MNLGVYKLRSQRLPAFYSEDQQAATAAAPPPTTTTKMPKVHSKTTMKKAKLPTVLAEDTAEDSPHQHELSGTDETSGPRHPEAENRLLEVHDLPGCEVILTEGGDEEASVSAPEPAPGPSSAPTAPAKRKRTRPSKKDVQAYPFTEQQILELAEFIKGHPALYDKRNKEWCNPKAKEAL